MNKVKRFAITAAAGAVIFGSLALPAFAVPPGPPGPAAAGCPGRSVVTPGTGAQASQPDLTKMANGECPVPAGFVPTVGP